MKALLSKLKKIAQHENAWLVFPALLYMFMQLSAWGVFQNLYSMNVDAAPAGWHIIGFLLSLATVGYAWMVGADSKYVSKNETFNFIAIPILATLSLLSYAGFVFNG